MSARPCKPDGHPWIVPYLTLPNVEQALAFYERAFAFRPAVVLRGPSGAIDHAEVVWEGGRIMLGPESEEHTARAPMTSQVPSPIAIYVYTDDVAGRYHTAIKEGAEPIEEPAVMPWGDRIAILADPWGYKWTFAQNLADFYSHVEGLGTR
jgi:PhnB protein